MSKPATQAPRFEENAFNGVPLYRFFEHAAHADALVNGNVWISTLQTCRGYEGQFRGDPEEGFEHYRQGGSITGASGDKAAGISLVGVRGITLKDNISTTVLLDGFVLCMTEHFDPATFAATFEAKFCVKIIDGGEFFRHVSFCLHGLFGQRMYYAGMERVIYREREYVGMDDPPGPLGYVKPPDPYQAQQEVRMLWQVGHGDSGEYKPFSLSVPEVCALCQRIT